MEVCHWKFSQLDTLRTEIRNKLNNKFVPEALITIFVFSVTLYCPFRNKTSLHHIPTIIKILALFIGSIIRARKTTCILRNVEYGKMRFTQSALGEKMEILKNKWIYFIIIIK